MTDKIRNIDKNTVWIFGITTVAFIAIIIVVAVFWDKIKANFENKSWEKDIEDEIKDSGQNGLLTPATIRQIADTLYTAMKGWGTDEATIYDCFGRIYTKTDLLKVVQAFGVQDGKTLPQYIIDELGTKERRRVNQILANNNIDYAF